MENGSEEVIDKNAETGDTGSKSQQLNHQSVHTQTFNEKYARSCSTISKIAAVLVAVAIIAVIIVMVISSHKCTQKYQDDFKKYWVYYDDNVKSDYKLNNVFLILERLGYKNDPNTTDWDLLWARDYPFKALYSKLNNLKPHQKISKFPGTGYITNKVQLATSALKYIPPAFPLPEDKDKLLEYAKNHPNVQFVQKSNTHRNIHLKKIEEINLNVSGTFVQEFVDKPLLVNGYKFDIGIYTILTSVDPLRIYIYNEDALLSYYLHY